MDGPGTHPASCQTFPHEPPVTVVFMCLRSQLLPSARGAMSLGWVGVVLLCQARPAAQERTPAGILRERQQEQRQSWTVNQTEGTM